MKLHNLSFRAWIDNHPKRHKAVFCREMYPWELLRQVSFCMESIGRNQTVYATGIPVVCTVYSLKLQPNGRYRADFRFDKHPDGPKVRSVLGSTAPTDYSVIFTQERLFVTSFAKGIDPYEYMVSAFMEGRLVDIHQGETGRLIGLFAKTLVSFVAEELYPKCRYYIEYPYLANTIRPQYPRHHSIRRYFKTVAPMFSNGRRFWLLYTESEEMAHRAGIVFSPHCERLLVIYLNPQLSRHHKCYMKYTHIISLHEFLSRVSPAMRARYDRQIRFLQTGLVEPPTLDMCDLEAEIASPKRHEYEITFFELREALSIMRIPVTNRYDAFYVLAGFNLINAYVNRIKDDRRLRNELRLFGELYFYKQFLAAALAEIVLNQVDGVDIYIDKKDNRNLVYARVFGFQFSFHYVQLKDILVGYVRSAEVPTFKKGDFLHDFACSSRNVFQEWSGVRLQPIAPLLLHLARAYKERYYNGAVAAGGQERN
jgi:hypothetical protein